jgi:Ca2+-binding RTX toxin-like protein
VAIFDGTIGNDTLTGGTDDDFLYGDAGSDILSGGEGNDGLAGGLGDDVLDGGIGHDAVYYIHFGSDTSFGASSGIVASLVSGLVTGGAGNDTLVGIEAVWGTGYDDSLTGDANANSLSGSFGSDTIDGGDGADYLSGGFGDDSLTGGLGSDVFYFREEYHPNFPVSDNSTDTITDFVAGDLGDKIILPILPDSPFANGYARLTQSGADTLVEIDRDGSGSFQAFRIIAILQNVIRTSLTVFNFNGNDANSVLLGTPGDDNLMGTYTDDFINAGLGNDTIIGLEGNDTLDGGAGADLFDGGLGNDTYLADTQADIAFEGLGEGTDTLIASTSFYLYDNIENLTLATGAGNLFGSANALNNTVTGNEGDNLLLGWDGNDTLVGNAGADILYGVEGNDSLSGGAGIDALVGGNGLDTLDGGNEADALYGEDGNDILYGGTGFATDILVGGAGNDSLDGSASMTSGQVRNQGDYDLMDGGGGDDTYYVDTPADLTFEALAGGIDTVIADINGGGYYLYANVENLTLAGNTPFGVGNELNNVMTGSILANWLLGGDGNDTLDGGAGTDILWGQAGADTFLIKHGTNLDIIADFTVGSDKLDISALGFADLATAKANMLQVGTDISVNLGGGDALILIGVSLNSITAADLLLV